MDNKTSVNPSPAKGPNARIVIIGAVAGGAAAAARLTRLNNKLDITLVDRSPHVSIASCGMPYYIGREIEAYGELQVHTPTSLKNMIGVTRVLVNTEAVKIDRKRKVVLTKNVGHLVGCSTNDNSNSKNKNKKKSNLASDAATNCVAAVSTPVDGGADECGAQTVDDTLTEHPYDFLIIATGASPIMPPIAGLTPSSGNGAGVDPIIRTRVLTLRNLGDMNRIAHIVGQGAKPDEHNDDLKKLSAATSTSSTPANKKSPISVAVIGAGFIGLEIAEQIQKLGHAVTIVERNPTVLPACDDEIGAMLHDAIRAEKGMTLITNDSVTRIARSNNANDTTNAILTLETAKGKTIGCDLVVLCVGVKAESQLARDCGLRLSSSPAAAAASSSSPAQATTTTPGATAANSGGGGGGNRLIAVDNYMRTSDPFIYAVGDAVEVSDGVFRDLKTWTPLATVAATEARIAADHIVLGKSIPFRGSFSTAIVRCFGVAIGTTGWSEKRLKRQRTAPYAVSVINGWSTASYYPGARPVLIKLTYCSTTGRLFGGQCVGAANAGVDKRIDVIATALLGNLTLQELSHGQFAYAPPFNTAKDPVTIACLNGRNISFDGLTNASTRLDPNATIVDVRPKGAFEKDPLTSAVAGQRRRHLFWATSREGIKALLKGEEKEKKSGEGAAGKYQSLCFWGRTSYFAHRNMLQGGLPQARLTTLQGGNVYAKALKEAELSGSKL